MQATPSSAAAKTPTSTKTTSAKPKSSQHLQRTASDPNGEIEEISKKISEHADAIYRTWKSRGLAPTELLEFYNSNASETSDFFAATTKVVVSDDAAVSTEGLQKLVNTFVIKDKEQRGVKTTTSKGKSAIVKTAKTEITTTTTTKSGDNMMSPGGTGKVTQKIVHQQQVTKQQTTKPAGVTQKEAATTPATAAATTALKPATAAAQSTTKNVETSALKKITTTKTPTETTIPVASSSSSSSSTTTPTSSTTRITAATAVAAGVAATAGGVKNNACVKIVKNDAQRSSETGGKPEKSRSQKMEPQAKGASSGNVVSITNTKSSQPGLNTKRMNTTTTTAPLPAPTTASTTTFKPAALDINLNFDLNLDLNLNDVNNLTQLQTQNLLKIKELLHQEKAASQETAKTKKPLATQANKQTTGVKTTTITPKNASAASEAAATATTTTIPTTTTSSSSSSTPTAAAKVAKTATPTKTSSDNKRTAKSNNVGVLHDLSVVDAAAATAANPIADKNSGGGVSSNIKRAAAIATKANNQTKLLLQQISNKPLQPPEALKGGNTTNKAGKTANVEDNSSNIPSISTTTKPTREKAEKKETLSTKSPYSSSSRSATASTDTDTAANTATTTASSSSNSFALVAGTTENVMEVARSNMPAPTKFKSTRAALTNGQDKNLGRPILTRGSVAERVLMFEKCPDVRNSYLNIKRPDPAEAPPKTLLKVKLHATPPPPPDHTSLQREIRSTKSVYIPRFYFPHGKPQPTIALERTLRGILSAFDSFPNNQVTKDELPRILKLCGLPFYWRMPVMVFCQQGGSGLVERQRFVEFWKQMNVYCHEAASRFVYILSRGQRFRSYIVPEDLAPLVQDVVDTHPGLAFLKEATEFHSRYVHTVIARIFYSVNRSWSGRITIAELKKSDLLEIITLLEEEDDINQIMAFFSYEHFYVIYCKFWELDKDHDLLINQEDLARHSDHALSTRIVERIFAGCVTRTDNKKDPDDEPRMSYTDFVWFLLSEEDKRTPTAIEYWFRCMDIDGDGMLSMYELEFFYEEQQHRMESIGIETLPFEDCLCQMLDMIKPQNRDCITLGDLKRCKMTHVFFDTFFNLEKYLDHEQRDPFASQRDEYLSDWDRFAAQEYELLITEENE